MSEDFDENISGIILTGGKSTRMGTNKAFLKFGGKIFIEIAIELLSKVCDFIIISANSKEYNGFGYPVIGDEDYTKGPIGGIYSCLKYSKTNHNIVLPVDTPYITKEVYIELLKWKEKFDHVVAVNSKNLIEPLHAYYNRSTIGSIEKLLKNDNFKIQEITKLVKTKFVKFDDSMDFFHKKLFFNFNDNKDLREIK
jgi:molybdopterin-guanine dinucleotide biosynthesis protein A